VSAFSIVRGGNALFPNDLGGLVCYVVDFMNHNMSDILMCGFMEL